MSIRFILLALFAAAGVFFTIKRCTYGIVFYAIASYLNPHKFVWGVGQIFPLGKIIAIATIVSFIFYKGNKSLPQKIEVPLMITFWLLASLGYFVAINPDGFILEWERFTKIILMILLAVCLIKTMNDLRLLITAVILSLGFYSIKGAIWTFYGGTGYVFGPPDTFFSGNNGLGLVLCMVLPFYFLFAKIETFKPLKIIYFILSIVTPLTIIMTKSRGSALTLILVIFCLILRAKKKVLFFLFLAIISIVSLPFIPESWYSRMETISNYEEDASAMGRINAWHAAFNLAKDRPFTGGGLRAMNYPWTIQRYAPDPDNFHDVHSIYFEVLGETGFPGLFVFLGIIFFTMLRLQKIRRRSKLITNQNNTIYSQIANAIQIGIIGYLFNGLFLGLAFFDLLYQYVGLTISLSVIFENETANSKSIEIA